MERPKKRSAMPVSPAGGTVASTTAEDTDRAMRAPLIRTKLFIPPLRRGLVPRPRLIALLEASAGHSLVVVTAPPGYGKTTLVADWVCRCTREVAWLSLDEGDNDPARFLRYLVAALQQIDGLIGRTLSDVLRRPQLPRPEGLVAPLVNDLASLEAPLTVVLDDYQAISSPAVHELVTSLVTHAPPTLQLVLVARSPPPLPLARWHALGQLVEITTPELRFTPPEIEAFLVRTMQLDLPQRAIEVLVSRTEGWIAGLQLAAIAIQESARAATDDAYLTAWDSDERYLTDYLVTEVLDRQTPKVRAFLRQTVILKRLSAPLCDAVTQRTGSEQVLQHLSASGLFVSPVDHQHEWYRYQPLFAQVLAGQLEPEERQTLHLRAARWYEANGLPVQAIDHVLAYGALSEDWADAVRLVCEAAEQELDNGRLATVRRWLDALPEERVRSSGQLATLMAWILAVSGELHLANEYATTASAVLRAPSPDRGKLLAVSGFLALLYHRDPSQALGLAEEAARILGSAHPHWHALALWVQAEGQERTSKITDAIATLRRALALQESLGGHVLDAAVRAFLATALHAHGARDEAVTVCQAGIARYTDARGRASPLASMLHSELGLLYYEAGQADLARLHVEQGIALSEQLGIGSDLTFCLGRQAQVLSGLGEFEAAEEALDRAHDVAAQTGLVDPGWTRALKALNALRRGDVHRAVHWSEREGCSSEEAPQYLQLDKHLVYARVLLAQGRSTEARRWLARLERFCRARELNRPLLTIHILQAAVAARSGATASAAAQLARALALAAPEGLTTAFLDGGPQVLDLLAGTRQQAPAFVGQVLSLAPVGAPHERDPGWGLVEPLSERELEVLRLVAAGLPNRQIAAELVIAVGTVKRHLNHVYGKLGVHSRTQAIAAAQDLRLLQIHQN